MSPGYVSLSVRAKRRALYLPLRPNEKIGRIHLAFSRQTICQLWPTVGGKKVPPFCSCYGSLFNENGMWTDIERQLNGHWTSTDRNEAGCSIPIFSRCGFSCSVSIPILSNTWSIRVFIQLLTWSAFEFWFSCWLDQCLSFRSPADLISIRVLVQLLTWLAFELWFSCWLD